MTKRFLLLLVAGLLVAITGTTFADQVSYTTTTPIGPSLTDWTSETLAFQKFNSALGTLISVKLDLSGSLSTTITVDSNSYATGTAKTQVEMFVQDSGLNLNSPTIDMMGPAFNFADLNGTAISGPLTKSGLSSDTYTASAILAAFTGTGDIVLDANTTTTTWVSFTSGNADVSQVTNACLTGDVTYTYEPIPEPMTVGLVSLGGLILTRKRKHS